MNLFAAMFIVSAAVSSSFALTTPLPGSKANLVLTLKATSQVGGFAIKHTALAMWANQGVTFEEGSIANPLGYVAEAAGGNYYGVRVTEKTKNFGTTAEPEVHTTQYHYEEASNLFSQKLTNKHFLDALIQRGYVTGITNLSGYKLVAVFPADPDARDDYTPPVLFFVENGSSIYYVGRQTTDGSAELEDALTLEFHEGAEKSVYRSNTIYKHTKTAGGGETAVEEDVDGVTAESGGNSGWKYAGFHLFPAYYDEGDPDAPDDDRYITTGTTFYFGGLMSYGRRLDVASGIYLTTGASLSTGTTSGYFNDDEYNDGNGADRPNFVTGSATLGAARAIPDIGPYLNKIPAPLSGLRQEIVDSYSWLDPLITVAFPSAYQVVQRGGDNTADIVIKGIYQGSSAPIEARWGNDDWVTIANPANGVFSGTLANKPPGQRTLSVRFARNDATRVDIPYVGIGDIFGLWGQSNGSGRGTNPQAYHHESLKACILANDNVWRELSDPTDIGIGQVDPISYDGPWDATGSVWPLVATAYMAAKGFPVAFVPCCRGGNGNVRWQPPADHFDRSTLYGSALYRCATLAGGLKAVLYWAGEPGVDNPFTDYTQFRPIGQAIKADLGVPVMRCKLQYSTKGTPLEALGVAGAVQYIWDHPVEFNSVVGPDLSDMVSDDGYHLLTDAKIIEAAKRWSSSMLIAF